MRQILIISVLAALCLLPGKSAGAAELRIEAVIWHFDKDYPGANGNDLALPIDTVYIKTHDGADWMSNYDKHPMAISGPVALKKAIDVYRAQGIDVVAWFVPARLDVEGQLQRAREVIDAGVTALYADVEPFAGFCHKDCDYLAENFWMPLRMQRPHARLGVIYDPRPQWHTPSAITKWLSVADDAAPYCYWETFAGQGVWGDPAGCVLQARSDLNALAPGRKLDYVPMLQGQSTPARFRTALDASVAAGSDRVSVWRRGVTPADIWAEIAKYKGEPPKCWINLEDNCIVREVSSQEMYILQGGARFKIADAVVLQQMGYTGADVQLVQNGFLDGIPLVPREGALLQEHGFPEVYVVLGGGRFWIPDPATFSEYGFQWSNVRKIPPGGIQQVPRVPQSYTRFMEATDPAQYVVVGAGRLPLNEGMLGALLTLGKGEPLYRLWPGGLSEVPFAVLSYGDVSCKGAVDAVDALQVLQETAGIVHLGFCINVAGDVNCDSQINSIDSLQILRHIAGLAVSAAEGCLPMGTVLDESLLDQLGAPLPSEAGGREGDPAATEAAPAGTPLR